MKLTIIVPAYNEEKFIAKTLKSLLNQKEKNFELIVINNNSKDKTLEIAKSLCKKVYTEKKKGYHNAVKLGVSKSKGDIIAVCDADSLYPPNWTKKVYKTFADNKDAIGCYGSLKFYDGTKGTRKISEQTFLMFMHFMRVRGIHVCNGLNFAFNKKAYLKVGGYDPKIYNQAGLDIELGMRLKKLGRIVFVPSMFIKTSLRRVETQGMKDFIKKNLKMYKAMLNNEEIKETYDEYNIKG